MLQMAYPLMGGNFERSSEDNKAQVLKFLDYQIKTLWQGLVGNAIAVAENQVPQEDGILTSDTQISKEQFQDKHEIFNIVINQSHDSEKVIAHILEVSHFYESLMNQKLKTNPSYKKLLQEKTVKGMPVHQIKSLSGKDKNLRKNLPENQLKFEKAEISTESNT